MKRIRLYGGFHDSPAITINVKNEKAVVDWQNGQIDFYDILTDYQRARLENHFCGIRGCTCGSFMRATKEVL